MAEKLPMLALSPTMEEGTIVSWKKREGERIEMGEVICEVETDKATMEYESPSSGILLKILVPEGGAARVGEPIAVVGEEGELLEVEKAEEAPIEAKEAVPSSPSVSVKAEETEAKPSQGVSPKPKEAPEMPKRLKASPLAKKLAEEHGIDLSKLRGSGPGGRIVKRDVEAVIKGTPAGAPSSAAGTLYPVAIEKSVEEIPVSRKRKIIAQRVSESKFSAPHYYLRTRVVVDELLQARESLEKEVGKKVSLNAFLIKLAAETIKKHPMINSTWAGDRIILYKQINIGLAVAQEDGLITPVVRDCGSKGILQIDEELRDLVERARQGKVNPDEYSNATFTISNLGMYDIEEFTAIINPPGSAILAVGKITNEPVVEGSEIVVRSAMRLTLSCDHRVIDGAVGAAFLQELKRIIESPLRSLY